MKETTTAVTVRADGTGADVVPSPSLEQAREFIRASKAESTLRGYRSDWSHFCAWCEERGLIALPASPEAVAAYIAECAGRLKVGSIQRRLNAIAEAHKAGGAESPTSTGMVKNTMKGIRRTKGTASVQKAPTLTADIRAMVEASGAGLIGMRDRALILLGFAGAFRRSEIVGLDLADLEFNQDGLTVTLRRSKTDQYLLPDDEKCYLNEADPLLRDVATILLDCGLRPEECFRLKWENVREGCIEIQYGKTDNARRRIPRSKRVEAVLDMRKTNSTSDWVFPAATESGLNLKAFVEVAEAKGIKFDEPYHASQSSKKVHVAFLTDPWGTRIELTEGLTP